MNPLLDAEIKKIITDETEIELEELSDFKLNTVWEYITKYIGYDIMEDDRTETVEGSGTDKLYLTCRPIISVSEVLKNGNAISIPNFTDRYLEMDTDNHYNEYDSRTMYDHTITDKIKVSYRAGYSELPNLVLLAAICMINGVKTSIDGENDLKGYKINTISYTFKSFAEKNEEFRDYLSSFRGFL